MTRKHPPQQGRRRRDSPPLGNGREDDLSDEKLGTLSRNNGPESQGAYAGEDYGAVEQGAYGDEDFDASYQRDGEIETLSLDSDTDGVPENPDVERQGPGRGLRGGEWAIEEPLEPPDELNRKVLAEVGEERRRDDLAIQDDVVDVLMEALPSIRELRVTVERGEVTLEGVVPDRATEMEASRLAARIPGVVDLMPRLRIAEA